MGLDFGLHLHFGGCYMLSILHGPFIGFAGFLLPRESPFEFLVFKKRPMKLICFYFKKILTNEISAKHTFYPGVRHLNFVIFKIVLAMPVLLLLCSGAVCRCVFSSPAAACGPANNCEGVRVCIFIFLRCI